MVKNNNKKMLSRNRKVLFIVDHKHRDLPGSALIGYYLKTYNIEVKYIALWQESEIIKSFNPGIIILNKPNINNVNLIKWKSEGRALIVADTEGNPQDLKYKMKIFVYPHFYFFWNKTVLSAYEDEFLKHNVTIKLAGCPRLDFYHEKFLHVYPSRESILKEYKLPNQRTITIATSTQDSHFSDKKVKSLAKQRNKLLKDTADYYTIQNNMKNIRDITVNLIKEIISSYEDINLIIKPHPNESIFFWKELIEGLANKNVRLMVGKSINHLLQVSDLHISHNVCTTTFEASLMNVPTIEIHTDISEKLYKKEHLYLAKYTVKTEKEAIEAIKNEFSETPSNIARENGSLTVKEYITKYFYKFDGERCKEYAFEINKFIENCSFKKESYVKQFLKNPASLKKFIKEKYGIIKNKMKKIGKQQVTVTVDKITDKRGRYDNRIKTGDEKYWFERFKKYDINQ